MRDSALIDHGGYNEGWCTNGIGSILFRNITFFITTVQLLSSAVFSGKSHFSDVMSQPVGTDFVH